MKPNDRSSSMVATIVVASRDRKDRPMRYFRPASCAHAAMGPSVAAAPPRSVMNSRRCMSATKLRRPHRNGSNEHRAHFRWSPLMSQLGQKRPLRPRSAISGVPRGTDIIRPAWLVRFVPWTDIAQRNIMLTSDDSAIKFANCYPCVQMRARPLEFRYLYARA